MAVGIPLKTTYVDGDVFSASDINDTNGTINLIGGDNYAAGKNKIINGDFTINQREFSSTTTTGTFGLDRWQLIAEGGTSTYSVQSFTLGAAPVSGYEGSTFARLVSTGQSAAGDFTFLSQRIEDVRTFAGQTVTVSFWAQSDSGTPNVTVELQQFFGTGGSPSATVNSILASTPKQAISTSWTRYTYVFSVPSISGKTLGTDNNSYLQLILWVSAGSDLDARTDTLGIQSNTFNFWGVQAEPGSVATAFQTATGTIQGELAACQRYYQKLGVASAYPLGLGFATSTSNARVTLPLACPMRSTPSIEDDAATIRHQGTNFAISSFASIVINQSALVTINATTGVSTMSTNQLAVISAGPNFAVNSEL